MNERSKENTVGQAGRIEEVGHTGVYPISGPRPSGPAPVRGQGELGHPEEHRRLLQAPAWDENTAWLTFGALLGLGGICRLTGQGPRTVISMAGMFLLGLSVGVRQR